MKIKSNFFKNKNLFITGSTGFVGKIFLSKILTHCHDIGKVFLLIREKNENSSQQRFNKIINNCLSFQHIRDEFKLNLTEYIDKKVQIIHGDLNKENLGLSLYDYDKIIQESNIFINIGASVSWNEQIDTIFKSNYESVRDILQMATIAKADHLVHISTIGVPFIEKEFEMRQIDHIKYLHKLKQMNVQQIKEETINITNIFGNTYTFAKKCSENLLKNSTITCSIIRGPSIGPSLDFPIKGWLDNLTGYTSNYFYLALNKSKAYLIGSNIYLNEYPVDIFSNIVAVVSENYSNSYNRIIDVLPKNYIRLYDAMKIAEKYFEDHTPIQRTDMTKPVYFDNIEDYERFMNNLKNKNNSESEIHRINKTIYYNDLYRFANFNAYTNDVINENEMKKLLEINDDCFKIVQVNPEEYVKLSCMGINKFYLKN